MKIEELEIDFHFMGMKIKALLTCDLIIEDWFFSKGDQGVPCNGGCNSPEPSTADHYEITGYRVENCFVYFELFEESHEIYGKDELFEEWCKQQVTRSANWDKIEEKFNEEM